MNFSIHTLVPTVLETIRYFFQNYTGSANLKWDPDPSKRTINILEDYDDNQVSLGEIPRIIVSRGGFQIDKVGLSNNLAEASSIGANRGNRRDINMVVYTGAIGVTIEARNKGTCELITDMTMHFLVWSRSIIMDAGGWKEFALPMPVTTCNLVSEENPGVPKFQCQLNVPWVKEEQWMIKNDGPELKRVLQQVYTQ